MSNVALRRIAVADNTEPFCEPHIPPRLWRGLPIRTPYFAAADFDGSEVSRLAKLGAVPKSDYWKRRKAERNDPSGILEALRFYGIPGWSSRLPDDK